jgi:hypothetical protein
VEIENDSMFIRFEDSLITRYVNSLEPDFIYNKLLQLTDYEIDLIEKLEDIPSEELSASNCQIEQLQNAFNKFRNESILYLVNHDSMFAQEMALEPVSKKIGVIFNCPGLKKIEVEANKKTDGFIIKTSQSPNSCVNNVFNTASSLRPGFINIKINNKIFKLPIAIKKQIINPEDRNNNLEFLAKIMRESERIDLAVLPSKWESEEIFWKRSESLLRVLADNFTNKQYLNKIPVDHKISKYLHDLSKFYFEFREFLKQKNCAEYLDREEFANIMMHYKNSAFKKFKKLWKIKFSCLKKILNDWYLNIEQTKIERINIFFELPYKFKVEENDIRLNGMENHSNDLKKVA